MEDSSCRSTSGGRSTGDPCRRREVRVSDGVGISDTILTGFLLTVLSCSPEEHVLVSERSCLTVVNTVTSEKKKLEGRAGCSVLFPERFHQTSEGDWLLWNGTWGNVKGKGYSTATEASRHTGETLNHHYGHIKQENPGAEKSRLWLAALEHVPRKTNLPDFYKQTVNLEGLKYSHV